MGDVFQWLAENTFAADAAIQAALGISHAPAGFAVLGLGRLGAREFDLLSDADVLFVRDEASNAEPLTSGRTGDGDAYGVHPRWDGVSIDLDCVLMAAKASWWLRRHSSCPISSRAPSPGRRSPI